MRDRVRGNLGSKLDRLSVRLLRLPNTTLLKADHAELRDVDR